jgi:hypothetical protein
MTSVILQVEIAAASRYGSIRPKSPEIRGSKWENPLYQGRVPLRVAGDRLTPSGD